MPANTPNRNYPYPVDTDLIDTAVDIQDLATALDTDIDATMALVDNKVSVSGDTMTGMLTLPGTNPTSLNHAVRKGWADTTYLNKTGDAMSGDLDMNNNMIHELGPPALDHDAARKTYVDNGDADAVSKSSGANNQTILSGLSADHFVVTDPDESANPAGPNHLVTRAFVNSALTDADVTHKVDKGGDTMTGPLIMGGDWSSEEGGNRLGIAGGYRSTIVDPAVGANMVLNRSRHPSGSTDADEPGMAFLVFAHNVDDEVGSIQFSSDTTEDARFSGGQFWASTDTNKPNVVCNHEAAGAVNDAAIISFRTNGSEVARIAYNATSTTSVDYETGCDYRLKERSGPITDAAERVLALARQTYRGHFRDSTSERDLLNAHDIAEVAPYCVSGEKDGEGWQMADFSKLVPLLVSALGSALERIDHLEARLA